MLSTLQDECPEFLLARAAGANPAATAVVGAGGLLPMQSAQAAQSAGVIEPVLVGDATRIEALAREIGWDISSVSILDAQSPETAAETAALLARDGEVAALMKGDIHTDTLLRAVLNRAHGLRTGRQLSHVFHMSIPGSDRVLCITDGAMNVAPDVDTRVEIARNAVDLMHALGNPRPKVAVLSAVEHISSSVPSSIEARDIVDKCQSIEGAVFAGPLAFDLAVSHKAAQVKQVEGPIVGDADVILVPTIETGNALFKMMVHFMSATAAGIVLGAKVPIMLTSRGDSVASRLASAALSAIYAEHLQGLTT
jgi:phosphotransacetylase